MFCILSSRISLRCLLSRACRAQRYKASSDEWAERGQFNTNYIVIQNFIVVMVYFQYFLRISFLISFEFHSLCLTHVVSAPASFVYNRKLACSYNICCSSDIVSGSAAIEMNGYTCYSLHRVLFRASSERIKLKSSVSLSLSLRIAPSLSTLFLCSSSNRGDQQSPLLRSIFYRVLLVLCVSEAEETRRVNPRSGVVKIRCAATPDTVGNTLWNRETERKGKRK